LFPHWKAFVDFKKATGSPWQLALGGDWHGCEAIKSAAAASPCSPTSIQFMVLEQQKRQKEFEPLRITATICPVIPESLKTAVDTLSQKERHELACYLTKLELQNDAYYWETIRERTNSGNVRRYVAVAEIQDKRSLGGSTIPRSK
jgi:hypothetical protein